MNGKKNYTLFSIDRRRFVGNTVKLAALGTLLMPVLSACNNKKSGDNGTGNQGKPGKPPTRKNKKQRQKWSHEGLVLNTQTNTIHFPTSRMYRYYDEIKPGHLRELPLASWLSELQEPVKIHPQQSGNILEMLALGQLRNGINDNTLDAATGVLSKAFTTYGENARGYNLNSTSFRLHELMLQLISLNNSIPASEKWTGFSNRVKKPGTLRQRQKWMENEAHFTERVHYILERKNDYIARLNQRAARYAFS